MIVKYLVSRRRLITDKRDSLRKSGEGHLREIFTKFGFIILPSHHNINFLLIIFLAVS